MLGGIVRGKVTRLRTPTEADLAVANACMADLRVRRGGHRWDEPAALETWKERFKDAAKGERKVLWAIEAEDRCIGMVQIQTGQEVQPSADISFFFLEPGAWRQGFGSDAALALHRYLFGYLDCKMTLVTVPADNVGGLRIAERLGYRTFGRGHDVYWRDGAYADQLDMRFDRAVWDERFGATEREYAPFPAGIER